MKRLHIVILALVVLNLALFANTTAQTETPTSPAQTERTPAPVDSNGCAFGGRGASSCNIAPGILLSNGSTTIGCSVTCNEGYFACCGASCTCIPVNSENAQ